MKRTTAILFFLISLIGCIQEEPKPSDILSRETMIDLLVEKHQLEMQVNTNNWDRRVGYEVYKNFGEEIYKKHGVDSAAYARSFDYYLGNVDEFTDLYTAVIDTLEARANLLDPNIEEKMERGIVK